MFPLDSDNLDTLFVPNENTKKEKIQLKRKRDSDSHQTTKKLKFIDAIEFLLEDFTDDTQMLSNSEISQDTQDVWEIDNDNTISTMYNNYETKLKQLNDDTLPLQTIPFLNVVVTPKILKSILSNNWLEGEAINSYLWLLSQKYTSVAVFDSYFATILMDRSNGIEQINTRQYVKDTITKLINEECRCILIPWLVRNNHWVLCAIYSDGRCIVLDSLGQIKELNVMVKKLGDWITSINSLGICSFQFPFGEVVQKDGWNCGVWVCKFAELIAKGMEPFDIVKHKDIISREVGGKYRKVLLCRLVECLLEGKLA